MVAAVTAENRHHIALFGLGYIGHIDHGVVHAHFSDDFRPLAVEHKGRLVLYRAVYAVGITHGQYSYSRLSLCVICGAVAYAPAHFHIFYLIYHCFHLGRLPAHHASLGRSLETQHKGGHPHIVVVTLGVYRGEKTAGAVYLGLYSPLFQLGCKAFEQLYLMEIELFTEGYIGPCVMGEKPDTLYTGQLCHGFRLVGRLFYPVFQYYSESRKACVGLYMGLYGDPCLLSGL